MAIFKKFINSSSVGGNLNRKQSSATVLNGLNNANTFTEMELGTTTDGTSLW